MKNYYFNNEAINELTYYDLPEELREFCSTGDISLWQGEETKQIYEFDNVKPSNQHYMATYKSIEEYLEDFNSYE